MADNLGHVMAAMTAAYSAELMVVWWVVGMVVERVAVMDERLAVEKDDHGVA
jgi:hypothetical protein